jgi:hypothetical protein
MTVRRALEHGVVMDDDDTVAREMDVQLEPIGAERHAVVKGE